MRHHRHSDNHHNQAAYHYDQAAEHHNLAARYHNAGNKHEAAYHAHAAQGHAAHAQEFAVKASKDHAEETTDQRNEPHSKYPRSSGHNDNSFSGPVSHWAEENDSEENITGGGPRGRTAPTAAKVITRGKKPGMNKRSKKVIKAANKRLAATDKRLV